MLITYEQEALANPSRPGIRGEIVYPLASVIAAPLVAKVEKNIDARGRDLVDGFVSFLWSPEAQSILVEYGFHSADGQEHPRGSRLDKVADPFTLKDLGGALEARRQVVEAIWRDRVLPALSR